MELCKYVSTTYSNALSERLLQAAALFEVHIDLGWFKSKSPAQEFDPFTTWHPDTLECHTL